MAIFTDRIPPPLDPSTPRAPRLAREVTHSSASAERPCRHVQKGLALALALAFNFQGGGWVRPVSGTPRPRLESSTRHLGVPSTREYAWWDTCRPALRDMVPRLQIP